jgi:hypothetical protein
MNERIEKLAEQCRIETYGVNGELLATEFDEQKFAELIIKECLLYTTPSNNTANNTETDRALAWAHQNIKEHFGVEE